MSLRIPLALAELLVGWLLLTSVGQHGDPWPVAGAVVLAAGAYLAGHAIPGHARPWAAAALGLAALVWVITGDGPINRPLSGPLHYGNANAALAAQAGAALAMLSGVRTAWARWVALGGVVAALVTTVLIGAVAASVGVVLVVVALAAPGRRGIRLSVLLSTLTLVVASMLPFVVGAMGVDAAGTAALSARRVALWEDGVHVVTEDPLLGAGARRFSTVSPTAAGDADTREAHAELLQRAAENGAPGVLLEAAIVAVVAVALGRSAWSGARRSAVLALAALAALWANAGVDYVLGFPAVLATGWALAGLGSPQARWRRRQHRHAGSSERPSSAT